MELVGSVLIHAPREKVWHALNDPQTLAACIPGCEDVREISPDELHARVAVKLGPVRARFVGKIFKSEVRENEGYRLEFEGSGGSAGFAKGSSKVVLVRQGADTELTYTSTATVGGKLGQIGGRLIDVSARQMADLFFRNLGAQLGADRADTVVDRGTEVAAPISPRSERLIVPGAPTSEVARVLWFALGMGSTVIGVLLGAYLAH